MAIRQSEKSPHKIRRTVVIPEGVYEYLREQAHSNRVSINYLMEQIMSDWCDGKQKKGKKENEK